MTKLSEQQKNVIKSMCKQMLDLIQKKQTDLDATTLKNVVAQMIATIGLEGSTSDINDMVRDL